MQTFVRTVLDSGLIFSIRGLFSVPITPVIVVCISLLDKIIRLNSDYVQELINNSTIQTLFDRFRRNGQI